jgi:anti-sigma factor RsiW
MMDRNTALKLQALLDGELAANEAAEISRRLERDPEARRLYDELALARAVLSRCEPEYPVPESREFYWSRIRREIERGESVGTARAGGWMNGWVRWLVPVGATALLGLLLLQRTWLGSQDEPVDLAIDHHVETLLADATSFSFRSESAGMTVVWVQSGEPHYFGSGD